MYLSNSSLLMTQISTIFFRNIRPTSVLFSLSQIFEHNFSDFGIGLPISCVKMYSPCHICNQNSRHRCRRPLRLGQYLGFDYVSYVLFKQRATISRGFYNQYILLLLHQITKTASRLKNASAQLPFWPMQFSKQSNTVVINSNGLVVLYYSPPSIQTKIGKRDKFLFFVLRISFCSQIAQKGKIHSCLFFPKVKSELKKKLLVLLKKDLVIKTNWTI